MWQSPFIPSVRTRRSASSSFYDSSLHSPMTNLRARTQAHDEAACQSVLEMLSLIHISEPTRLALI
eukprot:11335057-Alexandrium_andersonii.AAC.1